MTAQMRVLDGQRLTFGTAVAQLGRCEIDARLGRGRRAIKGPDFWGQGVEVTLADVDGLSGGQGIGLGAGQIGCLAASRGAAVGLAR